jgi:hypothetical protein
VAAVDLVQGGHEKILSIRWQRWSSRGCTWTFACSRIIGRCICFVRWRVSCSSEWGRNLPRWKRVVWPLSCSIAWHTTKSIPFNSSVDEMKARLEELPNIGEVDVNRKGPSKEIEYSWQITFYPTLATSLPLHET